jgi:hypothetical protein
MRSADPTKCCKSCSPMSDASGGIVGVRAVVQVCKAHPENQVREEHGLWPTSLIGGRTWHEPDGRQQASICHRPKDGPEQRAAENWRESPQPWPVAEGRVDRTG